MQVSGGRGQGESLVLGHLYPRQLATGKGGKLTILRFHVSFPRFFCLDFAVKLSSCHCEKKAHSVVDLKFPENSTFKYVNKSVKTKILNVMLAEKSYISHVPQTFYVLWQKPNWCSLVPSVSFCLFMWKHYCTLTLMDPIFQAEESR